MTLNEFNDLEKKVGSNEFNKDYKNINFVMFLLSIFGHIASIFLAYFLVSKMIGTAIENKYVVFIITFILLLGIETIKREVFDKFSLQYLKIGGIFNYKLLPLFISSVFVISLSFYATISGAREFSSKEKDIELEYQENVDKYISKIDSTYNVDILKLKNEIDLSKSKINEKDIEQTDIESSGVISYSNRRRINDLKDDKKLLNSQINDLYDRIEKYESEKKSKIDLYKKDISNKKNTDKDDNNKNIIFFILLSTIIEFLIIIGVYFNKYFIFRSYKEEKKKLESNPNYQNYKHYNFIIDVIYTSDTKLNDKLPSSKSIIEMCRINNFILLRKDIDNMFKLFNTLGIIRSSGSVKYFNKDKESAIELIKKYFKII